MFDGILNESKKTLANSNGIVYPRTCQGQRLGRDSNNQTNKTKGDNGVPRIGWDAFVALFVFLTSLYWSSKNRF